MKVKGLGETFGVGSVGSGLGGAEIASCGLGSVARAGDSAVLVRICAVVIVAGGCRRDRHGLGCRVGAGD